MLTMQAAMFSRDLYMKIMTLYAAEELYGTISTT